MPATEADNPRAQYKYIFSALLSIVAAGVRQGQEIEITCEGKDEKEALRAAVQAVESGLGENLKK